ncbi:MAG: GIY-YIG nuclease family protein [Candidatus Moraniibacteriota bacterium]|nr:MAG: GIY-YIG nuclease family protein [Candidatus Moranbacteria bacterium]
MYYTYILKSAKKPYRYIGSTENLRKRLLEHNQGKTKSIQHLIPFALEYYEAYTTKKLARKRELELKKNSFKKRELFERISE